VVTIDFADYEVRGCGARYVYRQVRWPGEVPRGWKHYTFIEGSLEVKLPTIWKDEKQSRAEAERRERLEERRVEEKESEERRCRCAKR